MQGGGREVVQEGEGGDLHMLAILVQSMLGRIMKTCNTDVTQIVQDTTGAAAGEMSREVAGR